MKPKIQNHSTMRTLLAWLLGVAVAAVLCTTGQSAQVGRDSRIMPPNAKVEGKSVADWIDLWLVYALTDAPINSNPYVNVANVQVGQVLMLAGNWGTPGQVTVKPGTFLYLEVKDLWGELRTDGSMDDANGTYNGIRVADWFANLTLSQTLDGSPVKVNLEDYLTPLTWWDHPIYYAETSSWNSVAGVWFQGVGFLIKPLTPGVHRLTNHIVDPMLGVEWTDTYTITVAP